MNYRYFCEEEFNNLLSSVKGYRFGECIYAIMSCGKIKDRNDLLYISDEDMHKLIIKTIKKEKDE